MRTTSCAPVGSAWVRRIVNLPAGVSIHVFFVNIIHNADHVQVLRAAARERFAQNIAICPFAIGIKKFGEALVDHHDRLALLIV